MKTKYSARSNSKGPERITNDAVFSNNHVINNQKELLAKGKLRTVGLVFCISLVLSASGCNLTFPNSPSPANPIPTSTTDPYVTPETGIEGKWGPFTYEYPDDTIYNSDYEISETLNITFGDGEFFLEGRSEAFNGNVTLSCNWYVKGDYSVDWLPYPHHLDLITTETSIESNPECAPQIYNFDEQWEDEYENGFEYEDETDSYYWAGKQTQSKRAAEFFIFEIQNNVLKVGGNGLPGMGLQGTHNRPFSFQNADFVAELPKKLN